MEDTEIGNTRLISTSPAKDSQFNEGKPEQSLKSEDLSSRHGPGLVLLGSNSDHSLNNCDLGQVKELLCVLVSSSIKCKIGILTS